MARLHSDLGQRTVYLPSGLAKAQGLPVQIYKDAVGTQPANLAAYQPQDADTPGAAIVTMSPSTTSRSPSCSNRRTPSPIKSGATWM